MLQASESGLIIDPDRLEGKFEDFIGVYNRLCLLYTSPSPRDQRGSRMPSSA